MDAHEVVVATASCSVVTGGALIGAGIDARAANANTLTMSTPPVIALAANAARPGREGGGAASTAVICSPGDTSTGRSVLRRLTKCPPSHHLPVQSPLCDARALLR